MAEIIFLGGTNPPDDSGTWIDDGWGGWTQDTSLINQVPDGFYDDGWGGSGGVYLPKTNSATLDEVTVQNINDTLKDAKQFEDTAVGRVLSGVLTYGQSFANLLVKLNVISDASKPISYANIDKAELKKALDSGQLQQSKIVTITPPPPPPNSTYFGVDFSKPLTWVVIIILAFAVFKIFNSIPPPPPTVQGVAGATKAKR